MADVILGKHFSIGGRENYEDRVEVAEIVTAGGLNLALAIVADGVGGHERGERAAQITIDTVLHVIHTGAERDVPALLTRAVQTANQQVYAGARGAEQRGMASTVAVAAILNGETLYVANVGDSRVYLCRGGRLTQLTHDHTYANEMARSGRMPAEEAARHPRAGVVTRAMGAQETVAVDVGLYLGTTDPEAAYERGWQGLPLQRGDAVLVCSDGLIKNSPRSGEPLTREHELVQALQSEEGDRAAQMIVAFALGRDPDDNVSAAVMQLPGAVRQQRRGRIPCLFWAALAVVLVGLGGGLAFATSELARTTRELEEVAANATRVIAGETAAAQALATPTPTTPPPTPTLRPEPAAGEMGAVFTAAGRTPVVEGEIVTALEETILVVVNHRADLSDGNDGRVYAQPGSRLALQRVTDTTFTLALVPGGDLFVWGGRYRGGALVRLEPPGAVFSVSGSCLAVRTPDAALPQRVAASCFEGACSVTPRFGAEAEAFEAGRQIVFDITTLSVVERRDISPEEALHAYEGLLAFGEQGRRDALACLLPYLPGPPADATETGEAAGETPAAGEPAPAETSPPTP